MAVSQKQAEQFFQWLTAQGVDSLRCEICQNNSFGVELIAGIPQHATGNMVSIGSFDAGYSLVPIVLAICDRCGCIKSFDAMRIGLLNEGKGMQALKFGG